MPAVQNDSGVGDHGSKNANQSSTRTLLSNTGNTRHWRLLRQHELWRNQLRYPGRREFKSAPKALRELRQGFAFHIAGDQHLGSTIQYGIDEWHDAGFAFCVPAISNVWPRRWYLVIPGKYRKPGTCDIKLWWPQYEAIIAKLLAYTLTGDEKSAEWHRQIHHWAYRHFPDPEFGEWYGCLHRDGRLSVSLKGNLWNLPRMQWYYWKLLENEIKFRNK